MPQKIEVHLLYPQIVESFTPEVLYSLRAHVFPTLQVLPKKQPKKAKAQPKRCPRLGVVSFGGNLDDAGWPTLIAEQNELLNAARKMDALCIWFPPLTKMPPDKTGNRKYIAEEFWESNNFDKLVEGLKHFVQGVEVTLIRRVVVMGTPLVSNEKSWSSEDPLEQKPKWIDVPKDRKPREVTREELLSALGVNPTTDTETTPS